MPFGNLLRSGINNISKVNSAVSGLQSFSVDSINSTLTRGLDSLSGNLGSVGGLLDQAGSLGSNLRNPFTNLREITRPFGELDQVFQGKLENLSRANIIGGVEGLSNISSALAGATDTISLFQTDQISQTLNGIRQNINVVPSEFGVVTSSLQEVSGAISNLSAGPDDGFRGGTATPTQRTAGPDDGLRGNSQPSSTGQAEIIPNPLREYASYNYIIELAALSPADINSPLDSYRQGLSNSILRSGGGNYNNRVTTFDEDTLGTHAEYYIDDFEVLALMSPNNQTGLTQGSNIRFSVVEPYSMGKFLEALQIAATQAGYKSYIEAPYVFKVSFIGLDQEGRIKSNLAAPPKFLPVKITNVEFDVKAEGSYYECQAIPWNELALTAQTSVVRTDVTLNGSTVIEALEKGNPNATNMPPLTDVLNGRADSIARAGAYPTPDRYIIMFPTDSQGASAAVTQAREADFGNSQGATQDPRVSEAAARRIDAEATATLPDGSVYDTLKAFARNNVNEIGRSAVLDNVQQDGDVNFAPQNGTYDEAGLFLRPEVQAAADVTARNYMYAQNTGVTHIIEDMILNSEFGRRLTEQNVNEEGLREWFRIETQVFLEEDPATQNARGTPAKIFVYSVYPWYADESRFQGPTRRSGNTEILKGIAAKEYNYYYTGLNEDVLDFQIQFKTAFFQNLFADLGQHNTPFRSGVGAETIDVGEVTHTQLATPTDIGPSSSGELAEPNVPVEEITTSSDAVMGGSRSSQSVAAKRAIAQSFQDTLINSNVDLVNAEMEIWGDPYWFPESGMGNYNAAPSGFNPNVTADGTVTGQHSDIFVNVNFRTPFDYNVRTGLMQFSNIVKPFSGVYMVTKIENKFGGGQFKQVLTMIRKRNQNDEATGQVDVLTDGNEQIIAESAQGNANPGGDTAGVPNNSGQTPASGYTGVTNPIGANIGYGLGQIDPALAQAAGILGGAQDVLQNPANAIGYGLGQIDPALAQAVGIGANGETVPTISGSTATAAGAAGDGLRGGSSTGTQPIQQERFESEIEQLRARRNEIDIRLIEIENQGIPAGQQAEYDRLINELQSNGRRLIELGAQPIPTLVN